ncbi:MAG: hypothetical protein IPJ71_16480 [Bdellovibrionales bacterium]|nr:hypothetical protein [Bdellovibrionales bacterium]
MKALIFLPILFIIVAINYFIDPANTWKTGVVDCMATALSSGINVTLNENINHRLLQKEIIQRTKTCPRHLVLGNSRLMTIRKDTFDGTTVNNSVVFAILEDYLGLFFEYKKLNCLPKSIIIGTDPVQFSLTKYERRWEENLKSSVEQMLRIIVNDKISKPLLAPSFMIPEKVTNLLSLSYFQESTTNFVDRFKHRWNSSDERCNITMETRTNKGPYILENGEFLLIKDAKPATTAKGNELAITYGNSHPKFLKFAKVSKNRILLLTSFIEFLLSKGIKVILYIPPFHPYSYQRLVARDDTKYLFEVEMALRSLGEQVHIPVVGSTNPSDYGLDETYFTDAVHSKDESVPKIIFKKHEQELLRNGIFLK